MPSILCAIILIGIGAVFGFLAAAILFARGDR